LINKYQGKKENDKEYGKFTVKPQDCMFALNADKSALNTGLSFVASSLCFA
jgi:hypothetical protein